MTCCSCRRALICDTKLTLVTVIHFYGWLTLTHRICRCRATTEEDDGPDGHPCLPKAVKLTWESLSLTQSSFDTLFSAVNELHGIDFYCRYSLLNGCLCPAMTCQLVQAAPCLSPKSAGIGPSPPGPYTVPYTKIWQIACLVCLWRRSYLNGGFTSVG